MPEAAPSESLDPRLRAWVEVDVAAIEANARALRSLLRPPCRLMAVVKADGYGHGAVTVARAALRGGAATFGVATLAEGLELRRAGIRQPVLVLGNLIHGEELRQCLHWDLMPTLSTLEQARLCQALARDSGRRLAVHLKVDTGMTRLGACAREAPDLALAIQALEGVTMAGFYSHLAMADGPALGPAHATTEVQSDRFRDLLRCLDARGAAIGCRHLANSAGTLRSADLHHDMVRVGLALYGHSPAPHLACRVPLRPALQVRARVTLVRGVPAGVGVSYGHHFTTRRPSRLAVVAIGYADGVPRQLSGRMEVLHDGQALPQVGAITMDQLIVDATDCPSLEPGATVTLLGRSGALAVSPRQWSERCHSIPWEILCGFKHRLPRLVVSPGREERW
jgi:alanine racemase